MDVKKFKTKPLLGIIRGIEFKEVRPLVEIVSNAGLETIEITMNTKDAPKLIKEAVKASRGHLTIGAGTVLSMESLKTALDSGATFIVMPCLVEDVLAYCVKNKIPAFPGALTPQEIYNAWERGAAMVKVFPAKFFGPEYLKEIRGPFDNIELLACSGVTPENLKEYFSSGASAISFGASVFRKDWLKVNDFGKISELIKKYIKEFNQWKQSKQNL